MPARSPVRTSIEGELSVPSGIVRFVRLSQDRPTETVFSTDQAYWVDLCLTPRPDEARGCYRARWGPHRFERLGDIVLVPPEQELHLRSELGPDQLSILCEIDRAALDRWLPGGVEWTDRRLATALDVLQPDVRIGLLRLAGELRWPRRSSAELARHLVAQLAIELARYCEALAEGPITGGLSSWRLRAIDERVAQAGPPPSLEELARLCSVSVRQLSRGFRSSRGCTIGEHISNSRVELAKRRLGSAESIKAVAFQLGFASAANFSAAFRRVTGMTPSHFRAHQRQRSG